MARAGAGDQDLVTRRCWGRVVFVGRGRLGVAVQRRETLGDVTLQKQAVFGGAETGCPGEVQAGYLDVDANLIAFTDGGYL